MFLSIKHQVSQYGFFLVRIFPYLDLIWSKLYCVNICIQSKYRKMRIRKNSVFGHFLRGDITEKNSWSFRIYHFYTKYMTSEIIRLAFTTYTKERNIHLFKYIPSCKLPTRKSIQVCLA